MWDKDMEQQVGKIDVIRVEPLEIPADIIFQISGRYHIALKDFYVYVQESKGQMYVNKTVPEKDIKRFIEVMTFPGRYFLDDDTEIGRFMDYVYGRYGYATYSALFNYHNWMMEQREEQAAKEKAKKMVPEIEKIAASDWFDECLLFEVWRMGSEVKRKTPKNICEWGTIYAYCLGYLSGAGVVEDDYSPGNGMNITDYYYEIVEMLEHIDIQEMPRIYGFLKETFFSDDKR